MLTILLIALLVLLLVGAIGGPRIYRRGGGDTTIIERD
jgi:hypothetical protein